MRLAFAFRQEFKKDVVVDMVCYRRYGHNEGDEPAFTQPRMYEVIGQRRSVRKLYTELLVNRGDLTHRRRRAGARRLPRPARRRVRGDARVARAAAARVGPHRVGARDRGRRRSTTGVPRERARRRSPTRSSRCRPASRCTRSSQRIIGNRRKEFDEDRIDWALAEALAFGSLLLEGTPVRARRPGHAARHVQPAPRGARRPRDRSGVHAARAPRRPTPRRSWSTTRCSRSSPRSASSTATRSPTATRSCAGRRSSATSPTARRRSSTSSSSRPRTSGASAAGSCCCSPTASKGQGPEHSSARLERFLVLCADDNMRVVYPTTAAQYFHVLRRQVHDDLRRAADRADAEALPAHARDVLAGVGASRRAASSSCSPTPREPDPASVTRLVLCSGKFGTSCSPGATRSHAPVAIVRLEQLYPWPEREIAEQLAPLPERRGHLGAGGAGQHGRPLLRPPPHRGDVRRPRRSAWSPAPRARAPRPAAPPCTTRSSKPSSTRPSPRPERSELASSTRPPSIVARSSHAGSRMSALGRPARVISSGDVGGGDAVDLGAAGGQAAEHDDRADAASPRRRTARRGACPTRTPR